MNIDDQLLNSCWNVLRNFTDFQPEIGIVLGTGIGDYAKNFSICAQVPYTELPGFPRSTAPGHRGQFVFGYYDNIPLVLMQGRIHYYEGYEIDQVVLPIRLMYKMGVRNLLLTNSAGGIAPELKAGSFMLISDHISFLLPSPLRGKNNDSWGVRFPDMSEIYDLSWRKNILAAAQSQGIELRQGVYIQTPGPQFETPAEIRMYAAWGASAVGMSTACEAIAAKHCGMRIAGLSCIGNPAAGISSSPLSEKEIQEVGCSVAPRFFQLINLSIKSVRK